jgi:hypothetical protein
MPQLRRRNPRFPPNHTDLTLCIGTHDKTEEGDLTLTTRYPYLALNMHPEHKVQNTPVMTKGEEGKYGI